MIAIHQIITLSPISVRKSIMSGIDLYNYGFNTNLNHSKDSNELPSSLLYFLYILLPQNTLYFIDYPQFGLQFKPIMEFRVICTST